MPITKGQFVLGTTAVLTAAITVSGVGILSRSQAFLKESPKELVDEVWQIVDRRFVDAAFNQVDWKAVRTEYLKREYPSQESAYGAIREMLKRLGDPYTRFMDPKEYKNMQIDTSGELTGVGIQLSQDEKNKNLVVISPIEDTPASKAGIQSKDIITKIDGKTTTGMDSNQAVNLIRGPVGTTVTLTIQRGTDVLEFRLQRARIEIHPVRSSYRTDLSGGVGYIRLVQFSANAAKEMRDAIQGLEKRRVTGYILDLRSNPGGLLQASVEIAEMWIREGAIVSTVDCRGEVDRQVANRRNLTDKPVVVLVNGGSASASEILSGALQDNKRALVVGTKTFGKGLVQSVQPLGDGSAMAVTIAKYLTPNGRDINKHGIDPDVSLELTEEQLKQLIADRDRIGTLTDPQYLKALETLKTEIALIKKRTASTGAMAR